MKADVLMQESLICNAMRDLGALRLATMLMWR